MQKERLYKRKTTVYNIWFNFNLNIESAKKKIFKNIFSTLFFLLAKFYSNNNYYENQY